MSRHCTPTLFTLGYQRRDLDEFLTLLTNASVDVLLDVRETAWSHKRGFSKTALAGALGSEGIEYIHASFAGNPKHLRRRAETHLECLQLYDRHLGMNGLILEALDELIGQLLDVGKRVCLMCYERHPDDCHRGLLASRWQAGLHREIEHLGADETCRLIDS